MTSVISLFAVFIVISFVKLFVYAEISQSEADAMARPMIIETRDKVSKSRGIYVPTDNWRHQRRQNIRKGEAVSKFMALIAGQQTCPELQELGQRLHRDTQYCDLIIDVKGNDRNSGDNETEDFCAHRAIMAGRSEPLRSRIVRSIRDQSGVKRPVIRWPNMEPDIFRALKQYIYTDTLDNFDYKSKSVALYVAANILGLDELTTIVGDFLMESDETFNMIRDIMWYTRWANDERHNYLKKFLLNLLHKAFRMTEREFADFVQQLCEFRSEIVMTDTIDGKDDREYTPTTTTRDNSRVRIETERRTLIRSV